MRKYLKTYFSVLGKRKTMLPALVMLFLFSSMLDLIGIGLIGPYITLIQAPDANPDNPVISALGHVIGTPNSTSIQLVGLAIFLIFVVKGIFAVSVHAVIVRFAYGHQRALRTRLMSAFQAMPYAFHLRTSSANLINAINNHTTVYTISTLVASLKLLAELIVCSVIGALLFATDALAAIGIASILTFVLMFLYYLTKGIISDLGRRAADSMGELLKSVSEGLGGLKEIKVLGREAFFLDRVDLASRRYADAGTKYYSLQIVPRYLIEIVVVGFFVAFSSFMMTQNGGATETFSTLGIFAVAALRIIPSFTAIMSGINNMKMSAPMLYDLAANLHETNQDHLRAGRELHQPTIKVGEHLESQFNLIQVKDVWFTYPGSELASVRGVTFDIEQGQSIGLMGRSGAGKSTLVDILIGFAEPDSGAICRDGSSIYEEIAEWRREVAYIPQDIFITDDTLKRNIALGIDDDDIDEGRLRSAIKLAQLEDVVADLDKGVNSELGEDGAKLSGGQKQRVALARAFYHQRAIVVMDEATSALDTETEDAVVEAISALKGEMTLIVIAHRLTTLRNCDKILKLERGEIIASGKYSEVV